MKSKDEHKGALLLAATVIVLPFAAWYGFVVHTLWGWFVVPLGVSAIGVWEAAGLYVFVRLLTMDTTLNRDDDKSAVERFSTSIATGILAPALTLAFAAIYHAFAQ